MSGREGGIPRELREEIGRRFGVGIPPVADRFGLEIEVLPRLASGGFPPLFPDDSGAPATLGWIASLAERDGWTQTRTPAGSPGYTTPAGGVVSFEPGGQVEYASATASSVDEAVTRVRRVTDALERAAADAGVELIYRGMAPDDRPGEPRIQLTNERYQRLARHVGALEPEPGPGSRMMLQTAAIHVHLDFGDRPLERWRLANGLVAPAVAIFADSPRYEGRETGHRSFRAHQWRELAPERTGLVPGGPEEYLDFALDADAVLVEPPGSGRSFRDWLGSRRPAAPSLHEAWTDHLSTLYPEVRPRGHLELRCFDCLDPRWIGVPVVFAAGLLYDPRTLPAALELLGLAGGAPGREDPAWEARLRAAGKEGLGDPERAALCRDLMELALEGAERLGPSRVGGASLERARAFHDRFTRRGRDPGHDARGEETSGSPPPARAPGGEGSSGPSEGHL